LLQGGGAQPWGRKSYLCAYPEFTVEETILSRGLTASGRGIAAWLRLMGKGFPAVMPVCSPMIWARAFEDLPVCPPALGGGPVVAMGWYEAVLEFDHGARTLRALGAAPPPRG
jgi:para-aminobenzoate synthetase component 1